MRAFLIMLVATLSGCSLYGDQGRFALEGSYTDYDAFLNAERAPFPSFNGRFLHFEDTRYVLYAGVDCRTLPVQDVQPFELLELAPGVDVEAWIRYHHADFGNEYTVIEPKRHALVSGTVQLTDVRVEQETRPYGPGEAVTLDVLYYRIVAETLSFGVVKIPALQTAQHVCYAGDGFGRGSSR